MYEPWASCAPWCYQKSRSSPQGVFLAFRVYSFTSSSKCQHNHSERQSCLCHSPTPHSPMAFWVFYTVTGCKALEELCLPISAAWFFHREDFYEILSHLSQLVSLYLSFPIINLSLSLSFSPPTPTQSIHGLYNCLWLECSCLFLLGGPTHSFVRFEIQHPSSWKSFWHAESTTATNKQGNKSMSIAKYEFYVIFSFPFNF